MPNTFALTLKAQNSYPASSVVQAATQQIPDLSFSENDLISGVFEVFGNSTASANTLATSGTTVNSVLAGATAVPLTNPITNATLAFNYWRGLYVTVTRRDPAVAPASVRPSALSTTSLAIEVASKAFTVAASLGYVAGMRVRATSAANAANFMEGTVTTYSSTTLTVAVDTIGGTGTLADWTITGLICAQIKSDGFGGVVTNTTVPLPIYEGGSFIYSTPTGRKSATSQTLTILLNGTTGLNVNVLVIGS
jgi:hypothetical protein